MAVGTASVMTEVPGAGAPEATAIEVPAGSEFNQARDDTEATLPEAEATTDAAEVARVEPPQPDDLSLIDTDDTESAAQPETGDTEVALNAPAADESAPGIAADSDAPVQPTPQAEAPAAPAIEEELSISTEPAQPALPDVSEEDTGFATPSEPEQAPPAEETADTSNTAEEPTIEVPEEPEVAVIEPTPTAEPEPEPVAEATTDTTADAGESGDVATEDTTEETAEENAETVEVQDSVVAPSLPVIEVPDASPDEVPATPEPPAAPEEELAALAEPEEPSGTIDDIAPNVTTDRLPSVTDEPEPSEEDTAVAADPDAAEPAPANDSLPPIQRFATVFENPSEKPLMSIVLIDDGSSPIGLDALNSFPYPLSFAVDTGWDGAGAAMQRYRDAGFEVLAMINLPEGQGASDTEVSMQTYLERVPEAVAVMEGDGSGLQAGREASEQLAQILRDTGHGAVLFPNGLNTAQKLIAREGVPSASVFRDFDAKGQNATVIRRFLDQAAFRAGQEEKGVIMVGRLRADTISALLLWGLQDRAGRVAIAPVSAVLTAE
ncbi:MULTISPECIES: divergent polysaccharide deacetylase family protein [unclassified Roseovarius]|uniref:divergent polysaccharide deacetylase family protein n=1 Tax=unclassified Roseovarius TaxID=2614913 RepID=UPI00273EAC4D|nr:MULTISPECIES: polysaccharide deacteylase family 2 protein [unclassified Roseovarius]